jgi:hypothetical protein
MAGGRVSPSVHLRDALAAVLRSDKAQREGALLARSEEARELRAAVRALVQHVEEQDERIAALQRSVRLHTGAY